MAWTREHNFKPGTAVHGCMRFGRRASGWCVFGLLVSFLIGGPGGSIQAAPLVLKIRVVNPSKTEKQPAEIKKFLPKLATPADVIDAAGLDMGYDVSSQSYYVHKTVELEPGQTRTFDVQIKDKWVIPEATINEMAQHVTALSAALKGTAQADTAKRLSGVLEAGMKGVSDRQNAFAMGAVKPIEHIRAYESNMEALERIRRDLGMLENLAIAAGKDPGKLMGSSRALPPVDANRSEGSTGDVVIIHIKVTNPSLTEKKAVPLRHEFPAEVKPTDIMDAGGLEIGFDSVKKTCYAYAETDALAPQESKVYLAPQESKVFDVRIRNPWAGSNDWIPRLEARAKELSDAARTSAAYTSVVHDIEGVIKALAAAKDDKGPEVMNEDYVAFSRRKTETLRELEARLMRLEELFQPHEKPLTIVAPMLTIEKPNKQTTWMIIYIILGFLAVVSLLFYVRWYGKSKAEKSEQTDNIKNG